MNPTASLLTNFLIYGLMPLWLLAGFGDFLCHRWQRIELSAGVRESRLHLLMIGELGLGLGAAFLLQINAAVLALLFAICVLHEITMWRDLNYASSQRVIPTIEQWLHGIQQAAPWVGLAGLFLLHQRQGLALLGMGGEAADWSLRWKQPPLPLSYLLGLAVALPFASEYLRCRRAPPHASCRSSRVRKVSEE